MRFGVAGNLDKEGIPRVFQTLVARFEKEGVDYIVERALAERVKKQTARMGRKRLKMISEGKLAEACDILISLGGDGTILRMARIVAEKGTPILGINLGKLGFLAEVSLEDLDACLSEIFKGDYYVVERMMLQASSSRFAKSYLALNDIVVDKFGASRVLDFETFVNGEFLATFTADGIIVSTPTGSTAYSLANGGPIVTPHNRAIAISPICPHSLTARPVIVPDDSVIRIKVASAPHRVHLTADGQDEIILKPPTEIKVKKAPFAARLVKRRNTSYYDLLRKKLNWGRDVRIEGSR